MVHDLAQPVEDALCPNGHERIRDLLAFAHTLFLYQDTAWAHPGSANMRNLELGPYQVNMRPAVPRAGNA